MDDEVFKPTLKQWLEERKQVAIEEIQIEVLEKLIQFESETSEPEGRGAALAVALLKPHLEKLKAEVAEKKQKADASGPKANSDRK